MLKNKKKFIFTIIVFVVIVSFLVLNVSANTAETIEAEEYDSCADYYFSELVGSRVPLNWENSCGYQATSMLLAYYDVYWNDNFIENDYENNVLYNPNLLTIPSSTFKSETATLYELYRDEHDPIHGETTFGEYLEDVYSDFFTENRDNGYLHIDLIYMGIDAKYYEGIWAKDKYESTVYDIAGILDEYFNDIFGDYRYYDPYNLNDILGQTPPLEIKILDSINPGTSREDVIAKMYELLNDNTPMLYSADKNGSNQDNDKDDDKVGHTMVAYNAIRDNDENIIDCELHTGSIHTDNSHTTLSDTEYTEDISILWLEIDESRITHVCSDNYVYHDDKYCSCQVYGDLHPEHVHEKEDIVSRNANEHIYSCKWGCSVKESHAFVYDEGNHTYACECGEKTVGSHSFTYMRMLNSLDASSCHYKICECGYRELEAHTFVPTSKPLYLRCSECGYERNELGGGSNVIKGKKEDEETE